MNKKLYLLIPLILLFIGLSIYQYTDLSRHQKEETADFIFRQIILCGKTIEESANDFEESAKLEFANRDLDYFFRSDTEKIGLEKQYKFVDAEIKRIRRFYSRNQELINSILIHDGKTGREFERDFNNYFRVTRPFPLQKKLPLLQSSIFIHEGKNDYFVQPIFNSSGVLIANIRFNLNFPRYLNYQFDRFYIGRNSWDWAFNPDGSLITVTASDNTDTTLIHPNPPLELIDKLQNRLSTELEHEAGPGSYKTLYSVMYPINLLGNSIGLVFSVDTQSLWKEQTQANFLILFYFLMIIGGIIVLFIGIIRQITHTREQIKKTESLLRTANQGAEVLLTDPDFERSMFSFLELVSEAFNYQRAFLLASVEEEGKEKMVLRYEWWEKSHEPLAGLIPGIVKGYNSRVFSAWKDNMKRDRILRLNEDEFGAKEKRILKSLGFRSVTLLPIFIEDRFYGLLGFVDTRHQRDWQDQGEAIFRNIANVVGGALYIQENKKYLIEARDEAETANRLKSEFLANMSHEIRTPMNSILGFSEIMLNTTDNPKQKNYLKTILDSGKTLLSLINDILDLSKIEAGQLEIHSQPTDMRTVLWEIENLFKPKANEKGIEMFSYLDPRLPKSFKTDDIRLKQILLNLVGNAVKFTESGEIEIQVIVEKIQTGLFDLMIAVRDTGIGIPDEEQERIFESFSQQYGQDNKKYGGTGLGLAISKRLATLMGGRISLESKPGKGSIFKLHLPNLEHSQELVEKTESYVWKEEKYEFKGSSILVVDDVSQNRALVANYLEKQNLKLIEAESGEIAIELARKLKPDLILMDIRMPGMSGFEATREIRKLPGLDKTPIIAFTASTMQRDLDKLKFYFNGYLRKPVHRSTMLNELLRYLPVEIPEEKEDKQSLEELISPVHVSEEIRATFNELFLTRIQKLQEFLVVDRAEALVADLENFAKKWKQNHLLNLSVELKRSLDNFDTLEIQTHLTQLKQLFEETIHEN